MKREAEQLGTTVDALRRELADERAGPFDVILMAHGEQSRLPELPHPKQLLELAAGETILSRTVQLVSDLSICKIGICAPPELVAYAQKERADIMARGVDGAGGRTLVQNMIAAAFKPAPDHVQLFLLADVVWCDADLLGVLADHHPAPIFYGRHRNAFTGKEHGELFALRASPRELEPFADCRTLWELHSRIGGHAPIRQIHGYTDDVDTPEDLAERLPVLRRYIELENGP
jgi:hypothetical protein